MLHTVKVHAGSCASSQVVALDIARPNINGCVIYVTRSPTCNCQLASIGCMYNLLALIAGMPEEDEAIRKQELREVLQACWNVTSPGKPLILIDVPAGYVSHVEKYCNIHANSKMPYLSTSGRNMCVFIIKI